MAETSFSKFFQLIHSCLYAHDMTCMQICIASIELILIPTWSLIRYFTLNILSPQCVGHNLFIFAQPGRLPVLHTGDFPPSHLNAIPFFSAFQVHVFGPEIIEYFSYGATPDEICYQIGLPLFFGKEIKT